MADLPHLRWGRRHLLRAHLRKRTYVSSSSYIRRGSIEGIIAFCKAVLALLLAVLAVAFVSAILISELRRRSVDIEVTPNAVKLMERLGLDVDVPTALVLELNDAIDALKVLPLAQASISGSAINRSEMSLKPFGLDATPRDLSRLARVVLPFSKTPSLTIDMSCSAKTCDRPAFQRQDVTLVLTALLTSRDKVENISVTIKPHTSTLNRDLKWAVKRIAERVLEYTDPLLIAVYYQGSSQTYDLLEDYAYYDDASLRALNAARNKHGAAACWVHVLRATNISLWGDMKGAEEYIGRVAASSKGHVGCRLAISARTAVRELELARCMINHEARAKQRLQIRKSLDALTSDAAHVQAGDLALLTLLAARQQLKLDETLDHLLGPKSLVLPRMCDPTLPTVEADSAASLQLSPLAAALIEAMRELRGGNAALGPYLAVQLEERLRAQLAYASDRFSRREYLNYLRLAAGELATGAETEVSNRQTFLRLGELYQAMAVGLHLEWGAIESLPVHEREKAGTWADFGKIDGSALPIMAAEYAGRAASAFRRALAADGGPTDAEVMLRLGDALIATGDRVMAKQMYVTIVKNYIDAEWPAHGYPMFLAAAARWGAELTFDMCTVHNVPAELASEWHRFWSRLGAGVDHDPCWLRRRSVTKQQYAKLGLLAQVSVLGASDCTKRRQDKVPLNSLDVAACYQAVGIEEDARRKMRDGTITRNTIDSYFVNGITTAPGTPLQARR